MTPLGRVCIEHAERVLQAVTEMQVDLRNEVGLSGRASVGVVEDIALTWLPRLLEKVTSKYSRLSVDLHIDLALPLIRKLEQGELDVALIGGAAIVTGFATRPLGHVNYLWMCKPGFISVDRPLTPAELQKYPILTYSREAALNPVVSEWFTTNAAHPNRVHMSNSIASLASLTMAGQGIGLLPRQLYPGEIKRGLLTIVPTSPSLEPAPYSAVFKPVLWPPMGLVIAEIAEQVSTFTNALSSITEPRRDDA